MLARVFKNDDLPILFTVISYIVLVPIVFWPLIFVAFLFFFDHPSMAFAAEIILISGYPLILMGSFLLGNFLYRRQKVIGWIYNIGTAGFVYHSILDFFRII